MTTSKLVFIFPGQGSQEVGMGQALVEASPAARAVFEQADSLLAFPLSRLCFEGPEEDLNDTYNTQVAIFTTSVAALQALREAGYNREPQFVAGHSLGEYSAYVAARVLSFEDGLRLVRERGRLMKKAGDLNPGSMAAIMKVDDDKVIEICRQVAAEGSGSLQVANYNAPGQIVISGDNSAVERGIELAKAAGARRALKLAVSIAAHSELMRVVADEFRQAIDATRLNLPEMPVVANITARPLTTVGTIREEMEGQLTSSVRWTDSVQWMVDQGVDTFIELGPKDVLTGLVRRVSKEITAYAVNSPTQIEAVLQSA